jgi:hypothetical protein
MSKIEIKDKELLVITEDHAVVTAKARDRKGFVKISFEEKGTARNMLSEMWFDQLELKALVDFLQKQLKKATLKLVEIPKFTLNEETVTLYDTNGEETEDIRDALYMSRKVYKSLEECNQMINNNELF